MWGVGNTKIGLVGGDLSGDSEKAAYLTEETTLIGQLELTNGKVDICPSTPV